MNTQVLIYNKNAKRNTGMEARQSIISAGKAVADIIRTTLGPRAMLKMLLDSNGSAVLTNDGNCVLREIEVVHPAAKCIIELSRTQDERVGDGTTSVVVLAGELLSVAKPFLEEGMHPLRIVNSFNEAASDCIEILKNGAKRLTTDNLITGESVDLIFLEKMASVTLGTKFTARFGTLLPRIAARAVSTVLVSDFSVDVRSLAKVEKVPGGIMSDSKVLDGIMINKDILHAAMRRKIENPQSETNIEMKNAQDWKRYLEIEEEYIRTICKQLSALKPDVVVCEKGVSDLAQHFLLQANISVLRRVRKSDLQRLALACGARVGADPFKMTLEDIGCNSKLFEVRKIGDDYWSFFEKCNQPKAVSILLRGSSRDVLSEIERNLTDAMATVQNVIIDPRVCPGGGATEMALSASLNILSTSKGDKIDIRPYLAAAKALEVIPRTLAENCGARTSLIMTELASLHREEMVKGLSEGFLTMGVDGKKGVIEDMAESYIWEPFRVKEQIIKTAFEATTSLLRIDDILSGMSSEDKNKVVGVGA